MITSLGIHTHTFNHVNLVTLIPDTFSLIDTKTCLLIEMVNCLLPTVTDIQIISFSGNISNVMMAQCFSKGMDTIAIVHYLFNQKYFLPAQNNPNYY